jgi:hypothetical protein
MIAFIQLKSRYFVSLKNAMHTQQFVVHFCYCLPCLAANAGYFYFVYVCTYFYFVYVHIFLIVAICR